MWRNLRRQSYCSSRHQGEYENGRPSITSERPMKQSKRNIAATARAVTLNPAISYPRQQQPLVSAAGIAIEQLAFRRMIFPPDAVERGADPKSLVKSTPYNATCTKTWSRSDRDSQPVAVGSGGYRRMMSLIH